MIADIHAQEFSMRQALAQHVWCWPGLVLKPYSDRMQWASFGVADKNGLHGGADKFCCIQVHRIGAPVALIEDVGADLYAVIERHVIGRNLDRTPRAWGVAHYCHETQKPTHAHGDIK